MAVPSAHTTYVRSGTARVKSEITVSYSRPLSPCLSLTLTHTLTSSQLHTFHKAKALCTSKWVLAHPAAIPHYAHIAAHSVPCSHPSTVPYQQYTHPALCLLAVQHTHTHESSPPHHTHWSPQPGGTQMPSDSYSEGGSCC